MAADPQLRLRTDPYFAVNPHTGASIRLPLGEADCEFEDSGEWVPFLRWRRGSLVTEWVPEHEKPRNPARNKLVQVARSFQARLGTDAGDEELGW